MYWLEALSLLGLRIHAQLRMCTYLLTQKNQCFGDWPVILFPDYSVNGLSSVPLPLVGPK